MGEAGQGGGGGPVRRGPLVYGADAWIGPWLEGQIPGFRYDGSPTIGVIRGRELVAGLIYQHHNGIHCEMGIAALPGRQWADRTVLRGIFHYPFVELGCQVVTALVAASNLRSLNLCTKLGFEGEAVVRFAAPDQGDVLVLKLWREKCRWVDDEHGQGRESPEGTEP